MDSVKSAVGWLQANPMPDLAFFDVQLADGLSFEIFEQVKVTCPVIFTTAYDAYALKAFKVNSVDYLLKPVSQDDLAQAFAKLRTLRGAPLLDAGLLREMMETIRPNRFKTRFMVKIGDQLSSIDTRDVEYFFGENKGRPWPAGSAARPRGDRACWRAYARSSSREAGRIRAHRRPPRRGTALGTGHTRPQPAPRRQARSDLSASGAYGNRLPVSPLSPS